jgi:succinyl-CoA synthetase beta subunit
MLKKKKRREVIVRNRWVFNTKLVAKPDQLIKHHGKAGLLALNKTWDKAKPWTGQHAGNIKR